MIRFSKIIISNFFFLVIACSCGFYSLSGSLPPHIRTISIPMVENETAEFGIAENISDGIQSRFNDEGILKIINDNADSVLRGTVKKVTDGPYTFNKNESVSEYRYKIDINIEWYDNKNEKTLLKGNYSGWGYRFATLSSDTRHQQTTAPDLRQTDDLLSAVDLVIGGDT